MSKSFTIKLLRYDTVLLSTYIEIAQTGNTQLLVIKGFPTESQIAEAWEAIVQENAKASSDNTFRLFKENQRSYGKLLGEYELVRLYLMKSILVVDKEALDYLRTKGFRMNDKSYSGYVESLNNAIQRSNHYITKIRAKLKELAKVNEDKPKNAASIEETLATMSAILGFTIPAEVTLARFNEYKRICKKKAEERRPKHGRK